MKRRTGQHAAVPLRPPDRVMRLERMGASFQTRLSFMRQLVRRMGREGWRLERLRFELDADGLGVAVYAAHAPARTYSLVAFTHGIGAAERTDRVIAEAWDATFSLFDGVPDASDIERLRENTPRQEAGRFRTSELVLARANKSMRLFGHAVESLAAGRQPDAGRLAETGYLMRTTAVYGSGKFGCADREKIADRPEMRGPFQAELLTVYLIRWMSIDLVNHVAGCRGGAGSAALAPDHARYLGIGNATGLGMAPFLIRYPVLVNNWVLARETALARVRALPSAGAGEAAGFMALLDRARRYVGEWSVEDEAQTARIRRLRADLGALAGWCPAGLAGRCPWDSLYRFAESNFSLEGQEFTVSLLLEGHGPVVDELGEQMSAPAPSRLRPEMPLGELRRLIGAHYAWALAEDYTRPEAAERFWYYSEEKLEPRVGNRRTEPGAEFEMPIAVARDISRLNARLLDYGESQTVADFLAEAPEYRNTVWRVQTAPLCPYGEIRDNLIAAGRRPLDILRFKLAFFGVSKFDPKSDLWTRVNMYQGAPLPDEVAGGNGEEWAFATRPAALSVEAGP